MEFNLEPFDLIAGCSLGTWSDRACVMAMLGAVASNRDAINTPDIYPDLEREYRDLAATDDDDVEVSDYEDFLFEWLESVMPAYCSLSWDDGELKVRPYVDDCLPRMDELPTDNDGDEHNPNNDDHILTVTDHGNVTLWAWCTVEVAEWTAIWSMV